jgi:hypothetical protein
VVNFKHGPLYTRGKSPRYPLDRRLGEPQNESGRLGIEGNLSPTETRTHCGCGVSLSGDHFRTKRQYRIGSRRLGFQTVVQCSSSVTTKGCNKLMSRSMKGERSRRMNTNNSLCVVEKSCRTKQRDFVHICPFLLLAEETTAPGS